MAAFLERDSMMGINSYQAADRKSEFIGTKESSIDVRLTKVRPSDLAWLRGDRMLPVEGNYGNRVISAIETVPEFASMARRVDQQNLQNMQRSLRGPEAAMRLIEKPITFIDWDNTHPLIMMSTWSRSRATFNGQEVDERVFDRDWLTDHYDDINYELHETGLFYIPLGPGRDNDTILVSAFNLDEQEDAINKLGELGYCEDSRLAALAA